MPNIIMIQISAQSVSPNKCLIESLFYCFKKLQI